MAITGINFRADNMQNTAKQQKKNIFSVSDNAKDILNKTNPYACGENLAKSIKEPENFGNAMKDAVAMPLMSSPTISTMYTLSKYKDGNISKEDMIKILAYNSLAQ